MSTIIKLTPPGGIQEEIKEYESCSVNMSITDRAGSFNLTLPFKFNADISRFTIGTDVEINQNGHVFKGWVIKPPITRNGSVKTLTLEGSDYTAKTQKIVVTESYVDVGISDIVEDLFAKYVPWATRYSIKANNRPMTIRFPDTFLWDAMEQICTLSGFDWFIDKNLDVNFFELANSVSNVVINDNSYKRGTARFEKDSSKLVNKLWVKGAKALSLPFTQSITVNGTTPIPLFYKPRASEEGITIIIDGATKTLGIQNITKESTKDFLINFSEKLLIPDMCNIGTGTIIYSYEYPIKILLESEESKSLYGEFEDILNVDIDDGAIAREVGSRWIEKYSKPITIGSIEPFSGIYNCGELIKVEINSLDINDYLLVKSVSYESIAGEGTVDIKVSLENTQTDLTHVIKDINKRLKKLETALFGNDRESVVEKYKTAVDKIVYPKLNDDGHSYKLHDYLAAGSNIVGGVFTV